MTQTSLSDLLHKFLTAKRAAGLSLRTVDWYAYQISVYLKWLDDTAIAPEQVFGVATLEAYLSHLRETTLSPHSIAGAYVALRVWFNWLASRGHLMESQLPTRTVPRPKVPAKLMAYVKLPEFRRLYAAIDGDEWLDQRDKLILLLLFWSGLRVGELCGLRLVDVDAGAGLVAVQRGKGGRARLVPVAPEVGGVLLAYLYARPMTRIDKLLLSTRGGQLTHHGIRHMLERRCQAAGLPYLNPHAFRHGFAMTFLNGGMDMSAVSKAMGHASEAITEKNYARWLTEGLSREYAETRKRLDGLAI